MWPKMLVKNLQQTNFGVAVVFHLEERFQAEELTVKSSSFMRLVDMLSSQYCELRDVI